MAKKIRFPLEMKDGAQVRTLGELKENWDLEKVRGHFLDGRLATWLSDRFYEDEAAKVAALDGEDNDLLEKLCAIFGMKYEADESATEDVETLRDRNERLNRLRQYTTDKEILDHIDHVAFTQEELVVLAKDENRDVYLCNGNFTVPIDVQHKQYIGIGKVVVVIESEEFVD